MNKTLSMACGLLLSAAVYAQENTWARIGLYDPTHFIFYTIGIVAIVLGAAIYYKQNVTPKMKKFMFILIAVSIAISTVYLSGATVYLNLVSATGGPVHWHADYEVWACGVKYDLIDPTGLDNRVGPPLLHEHNENRIHVEGVPLLLSDVTLGNFFRAVGGEFTGTKLVFPTNDGVKTWTNGDRCNGLPARWYVFVNEEQVESPENHIYAPFTTVPPGDVIKLVFTEKNDAQINKKLFEVP